MKIKKVEENYLLFDNGEEIACSYGQECCEYNYADFKQIEDLAYDIDFKSPLKFELTDEYGFRFGNENYMVFVPCYSIQNGYYSNTLVVHYNNKLVLTNVEAEIK